MLFFSVLTKVDPCTPSNNLKLLQTFGLQAKAITQAHKQPQPRTHTHYIHTHTVTIAKINAFEKVSKFGKVGLL